MGERRKNERKFGSWRDLAEGGRRYELMTPGRSGWHARYFKEVDSNEKTLRFWQEIYNGNGELVEIHEKYPIDKGHRKV